MVELKIITWIMSDSILLFAFSKRKLHPVEDECTTYLIGSHEYQDLPLTDSAKFR